MTNNRLILQDLLALVCMLLRKNDISGKVLDNFVNKERNFCRKLSFCSGRVKISTSVVFLIWITLHFITELPDVSVAWEKSVDRNIDGQLT